MSKLTILKDLGIVTVKAAIIATLVFALTTMLITQAHAGTIKQGDPSIDPVTTAAGPLNNAPGSDARPDKQKTLEIVIHEHATTKVHIANKNGNSFDLVPNVGETE